MRDGPDSRGDAAAQAAGDLSGASAVPGEADDPGGKLGAGELGRGATPGSGFFPAKGSYGAAADPVFLPAAGDFGADPACGFQMRPNIGQGNPQRPRNVLGGHTLAVDGLLDGERERRKPGEGVVQRQGRHGLGGALGADAVGVRLHAGFEGFDGAEAHVGAVSDSGDDLVAPGRLPSERPGRRARRFEVEVDGREDVRASAHAEMLMDAEARSKQTMRHVYRTNEADMPDDAVPRRRGRPPKPREPGQSPTPLATALGGLLKERGLSALGLARGAGLADDAVRNIISGRSREPRGEAVAVLAAFLGVGLESLLAGNPTSRISSRGHGMVELPGRAWVPVRRSGPAAERLEARNAPSWTLPLDALGGRDPAALVVYESDEDGPGVRRGDRLVVDTSDDLPSPPGLFVVHDGVGILPARLSVIPGAAGSLMRITDAGGTADVPLASNLKVLGRVVARWTLL